MNNSDQGMIQVEGTNLPYVIEGEGQPCIMIGSPIYNPRTFDPLLRQYFKFIFFDTRMFVPNDFELQLLTIERLVTDIEVLRHSLNLEQVMIMGHSVTGLIALEYAHRYPKHVSKVALIATPACGLNQLGQASDVFWEQDASAERKAQFKENWAKQNESPLPPLIQGIVNSAPLYWYDYKYNGTWLWEGVAPNEQVFSHLFGSLFKDYSLPLDAIPAPIFLALGRYDYSMPYTLWVNQLTRHPHLTHHLFEASGHTPQLEESTLFAQKLIDWSK